MVDSSSQDLLPHPAAAAVGHPGVVADHYVAPQQRCVKVPITRQVCHQEPVQVTVIEGFPKSKIEMLGIGHVQVSF